MRVAIKWAPKTPIIISAASAATGGMDVIAASVSTAMLSAVQERTTGRPQDPLLQAEPASSATLRTMHARDYAPRERNTR